jgi:1-acyl-sn-glycerol-3-phosphate acyltransferase
VVSAPVRRLFDPSHLRARPGTIHVRILPPIPAAGLTEDDVPELLATAQGRMQAVLDGMVNG